ncbi:putative quinol monooxygenase [Halocynthiibacter styelae]|uniref:Antibiotic biosynthesis monooxygenase n=1 Tax=Halocynthiibacter styelae TaxID=2761955 RepID=A0A8J7IV93_9RHOB|nr:putative quinol monooxygenase [Paenihalocynthiibacter styelae]MBI1492145.1 antibiotic biosynthesis monooxygenase [Paenihalocynthiibacter styelae]
MKIQLNGYILVPDDRLDAVRAGLIDHIRLTHQEPGCISFEVTENPDIPGRFDVAETFTDQAAFDAHQTRTKASPWAEITAGIPRDYEITEVPG